MKKTVVSLEGNLFVYEIAKRLGGVSYRQRDKVVTAETAVRLEAEWKGEKTVYNKDELKMGSNILARCSRAVAEECYPSALGMICPIDRESALQEIVDRCRTEVRDFNAKSVFTKLEYQILIFKFSQDQASLSADLILNDIQATFADLKDAIEKMDYKQIRDTLVRFRGLEKVLPAGTAEKLESAVEQARKIARDIKRRVEKKGEQIEEIRTEISTNEIDLARIAFLETEESPAEKAEELDSVNARSIEI
jgi:hypothetical protein